MSIALRIKHIIGLRTWRILTRPLVQVLKIVPNPILYRIGNRLRKNSYPYSLLESGDTVVQIGAPRDLLLAGRSRSIYFALCVRSKGHTVIFEPEPESILAMEKFLIQMGLQDCVTLVPKGAWDTETELKFYSNPDHPASNVVAELGVISEAEREAKGYEVITIPVTTVDRVLSDLNLKLPKLISITTNGAEEEILAGSKKIIDASRCHIAVAGTGLDFENILAKYGYAMVAKDDRGFTFRKV